MVDEISAIKFEVSDDIRAAERAMDYFLHSSCVVVVAEDLREALW
jgi:hypothetical protein